MRAFILISLFLLPAVGCSSSSPAGASINEGTVVNPLLGTWALPDSSSAIHFLSTGDVTLQPGNIVAALNRLQNTQRTRYTSHLLYTGRYEILNQEEVLLHITADWTGKGKGARRPADRRVESTILFEIASINKATLTLQKKSLIQNDEVMPPQEEEFQLTLFFIE